MSVLLVNLGTTEAPTADAVRRFLEEFLSDPEVVDYPRWLWRPILGKILRSRPAKVAEMYRAIWTDEGSPLESGTRRIAESLGSAIKEDVQYAFRYGKPALEAALSGASRVVPLFPQRTGSTTGTIEAVLREQGALAALRRIAPDAPGYIEALAERWTQATASSSTEHLVVSFHGIPVRYDRGEKRQYRRDCETTFQALLARIDWSPERATLTYQSRFGPEPWLGPQTASVLERLGRTGARSVAVTTPGFLTEGLETLEEIGIRGRKTFEDAGGERFVRVPCVEAHPAFIEALREAVK